MTSAINGSITDVLDLMKHHHLTHFLLVNSVTKTGIFVEVIETKRES